MTRATCHSKEQQHEARGEQGQGVWHCTVEGSHMGLLLGLPEWRKRSLMLENIRRQHHDKNCANSRNISLISLQADKSQLKERLRCYLLVICA